MASKTAAQEPVQGWNSREWIRLVAVYLLFPLVLFLSAWDLAWWQGWAYSLLFAAAGIGGHIWSERRHPGLLAERLSYRSAPGVKPWDKVLAPLLGISTSFLPAIVAGLDHRFGWWPAFPTLLNAFGLILAAAGYAFALWAAAENRFFASVVRIQLDRGLAVCDSGPYRIVRHPGYAGLLLTLPGIVLALSSAWTSIPAALALVVIVIRAALEDRTLQAELPGYREYARGVRYRLVPWVY
jgi:protein-S-isoprenylcysteine O-methyltransferase Ste14